MKAFAKRVTYWLAHRHPAVFVRLLPPWCLARFRRNFFTSTWPDPVLGRIIREELSRRYYTKDEDTRRRHIAELWGGRAGKMWHEQKKKHLSTDETGRPVFVDVWRRRIDPLVNWLAELCARDPRFSHICDIGVGNANVLCYLSSSLSRDLTFEGIDLNEEQIRENEARYKESALTFACTDALRWVRDGNAKNGTIFVCTGTLMFFSEQAVRELLIEVRDRVRPAAFLIAEPSNLDTECASISEARGNMSWGHNYWKLFTALGYDPVQYSFVKEATSGLVRMLVVFDPRRPDDVNEARDRKSAMVTRA